MAKVFSIDVILYDDKQGYGGREVARQSVKVPASADPERVGKIVTETVQTMRARDTELRADVEIEAKS